MDTTPMLRCSCIKNRHPHKRNFEAACIDHGDMIEDRIAMKTLAEN